jgi:4-carboxymuconolactone decarboxylase
MAASRSPRRNRPRARRRAIDHALAFAVAGSGLDPAAVRRRVVAARAAGVRRRVLEETALMLVLYAGYPAALEALRALNQAWPGRPRRTREGGPVAWQERGAALCRRVYGPRFERLVASVRDLHPDLARWMIEQGYGRVLARGGMSAAARERVTVGVLAACGRERQLVSHLLGARRLGATPREIARAWRAGRRHAPPAARAAADRAWRAAFAAASPSR